jgi:radical SAM superfamily enzyme YgiQ (UPF0313 family)
MLLLINAPFLYIDRLERAASTTHLHLIYSFLRARGVEVRVVDPAVDLGLPCGNVPAYLDAIAETLSQSPCDVAGVSAWTSYQFLGAMAVGRLLRDRHPELPIAVGGYHATALPEDFQGNDSPFDYVVQGPGEQFLLALCRSPKRAPCATVVRGLPAAIDDISYDWSYPYHQDAIFLSRGCPHACVYCSKRSSTPEQASVAHALVEYERAAKASRSGFVRIQDACFGIAARWRREFLVGLSSKPGCVRPDVEVRVDQLEQEDIALLGRLRAHVYFGVESGSPTMLGYMNKTRDPVAYLARLEEVLRACDCHGVDYSLGAIVNHPGECPETLEQSVDAFWRWVWRGPSDRMIALVRHCFAYFPGSPFADRRDEYQARFGTVVHHPTWWHSTEGDQRALSEDTTASHALSLREAHAALQKLAVADFVLRSRSRTTTPE